MARQLIIVLTVFLLSSCDATVPAPMSVEPLQLTWDLSQDNHIERVHWPAGNTSQIWLLGPGAVHLKIRGGGEHDVRFDNAQVAREGARVKTIRLFRDIGTVETVYADAMKLASEWQINDTKNIEVFRDTKAFAIQHGGDGLYSARGGDEIVQGRSIEIRESFNSVSGKPFLALLALGFYPDYDIATTQPNTPLQFAWDLSRDSRVERVDWPADFKGSTWLIDGPGIVHLKLHDDAEQDIRFRYARVDCDGDQLKAIRLELDKGKLETVYADAMKLATDWHVADTREIQEFKSTFAEKMLPTIPNRNDDPSYFARGDAETRPERLIEIRRNFELLSGKPYFAVLILHLLGGKGVGSL